MYSFILMERCCGYHLRFIRQVTKIFIIQPEPYILYIKGFDTTTTFCCYVHRIIVFYETTSLHRSYVINLRQSLASILSFILKNSSLFEGTDGTSLLILFLGFQGKGNIIFDRTVPSKKTLQGPFTNYVGWGQVIQKCPLFVNVLKVENVNEGGQVVKKSQKFVNLVCERPLTLMI